MSSVGVLRDLAGFFLPIGFVGAAIAVLCAIIAAVALSRGAAGLAGGAIGCWIVGAMLSLTAGFSGQWLLVAAAGAALVAALVLGALTHAVIRRIPRKPPLQGGAELDAVMLERPRLSVLTTVPQR